MSFNQTELRRGDHPRRVQGREQGRKENGSRHVRFDADADAAAAVDLIPEKRKEGRKEIEIASTAAGNPGKIAASIDDRFADVISRQCNYLPREIAH